METEFIPLDYDSFDWNGKNYLLIYGRDQKGKRIGVIDKFSPYIWVVMKDGVSEKRIKQIIERIEDIEIKQPNRTTRVEKIDVANKKFLGKDVRALKVFITNYKDGHAVADQIDFPEILARREYDINMITKYVMETDVAPLHYYKVKGEILNNSEEFGGVDKKLEVDFVIKAEKIEKIEEKEFSPRILAYDIETDEFEIGKGEILMISLAGRNFKRVLTWKKTSEKPDYVECFKDESEMLEKFVEYVKKESPDFLVGYFSDGFDMPYLRARCQHHGVKLSLGLDGTQPSFARGRIPSARISGIVHIDLFRFIETVLSQYLQSETLGLNDVASELLGEKKKEFEFKKSSKINEHEWKSFFEYNLQDSLLTYKLSEKLWQDIQEFSKVVREPIFEITRDGMSQHVENYILHNLKRFNEIAEKRPIHDEIETRREMGKYEGAFVLAPTAGLYEDLAIFDFTSMHASIIVSFNISKATILEKKEKDSYPGPEFELDGRKRQFYFSKERAFFSELLAEVVDLRKKYKKELKTRPDALKKARSNAFKLLANAYYGYLGFYGARYYCREAAASTLAFVREFCKQTIDKTNKEGYRVIFSDTDSVGFLLNGKGKPATDRFLEKLNEELPGIMELELEDYYKRGIWVMKRTGEFGAKKKYALIDEKGKMKIRGFETVRRDWCDLARELQSKVLEKILRDGNEKEAMKYFEGIVRDLKERKTNKKEIMIRTQLKKPIGEYKSVSPHVIAAQKMKDAGIPVDVGMMIEYFIAETREKKKLVREKVKLIDEAGEYNLEYYLDHQIIPAVENIFGVFGINIKEKVEGKRQMKLSGF